MKVKNTEFASFGEIFLLAVFLTRSEAKARNKNKAGGRGSLQRREPIGHTIVFPIEPANHCFGWL